MVEVLWLGGLVQGTRPDHETRADGEAGLPVAAVRPVAGGIAVVEGRRRSLPPMILPGSAKLARRGQPEGERRDQGDSNGR